MTEHDKTLPARIVTGVAACMVVATAAATAVGFWLSYRGLHDFALRAGLTGAEAWAWPASVDLFIAAGEAGVTISALRRQQDWAAWVYLAVGFAASVTGNVLHVDPAALFWTRYAVAAVPPVAAMLALAALLRQAYRLATEPAPAPVREATVKAAPKASARTTHKASGSGADAATRKATEAIEQGQPVPSARELARVHHIGRDKAGQIRARVLAESNGHGT